MLFAGTPTEPAVSILTKRLAEAGFAGHIKFIGVRGDIERLMIASDVLLFPSRGEGLGMAAVEAQAAGLPVLASTSVPRECVVVPQLVRFQEVKSGTAQWVEDLLKLMSQPRDPSLANRELSDSAFAIRNSAHALLKLYETGSLG
jgi:glycosyltransferase involved in cell wall biosynthesis